MSHQFLGAESSQASFIFIWTTAVFPSLNTQSRGDRVALQHSLVIFGVIKTCNVCPLRIYPTTSYFWSPPRSRNLFSCPATVRLGSRLLLISSILLLVLRRPKSNMVSTMGNCVLYQLSLPICILLSFKYQIPSFFLNLRIIKSISGTFNCCSARM